MQIPKLKGNKKYKDAPRYKLIYEYEGVFKKNYERNVDSILNEIGRKLKSFSSDSNTRSNTGGT